MHRKIFSVLVTAALIAALGGCLGKGGGSASAPAAPSAVVKISSQGTLPPGTQIGGIDITVTLPAGVTVKATPDSLNPSVLITDPGVATASGTAAGSTTAAAYTAATDSLPATVRILLANQTGFDAGEFVTVNCDRAGGSAPTAADFAAAVFSIVDLNGHAITGLTAAFSVELQ